jgi:hypothetical protein
MKLDIPKRAALKGLGMRRVRKNQRALKHSLFIEIAGASSEPTQSAVETSKAISGTTQVNSNTA